MSSIFRIQYENGAERAINPNRTHSAYFTQVSAGGKASRIHGTRARAIVAEFEHLVNTGKAKVVSQDSSEIAMIKRLYAAEGAQP